MQKNQNTRSVLNVIGFIAFVLFSFAASLGLLILIPIVICHAFGVRLLWGIPIGVVFILFLLLFGSLKTESSIVRMKLPKRFQRITPEHFGDIQIVFFGTIVGPIVIFALTKSFTLSISVGVISFIYFFHIQSVIRASRKGLKFIPHWHNEQQKFAQSIIGKLRSNREDYDEMYCLFLRPFDLIPYEYNIYRDEYIPMEEQIAEAILQVCPVLAIGRELSVGPGYIISADWQRDVALLMKHAIAILLLPDKTQGMKYEINHIIQNYYLPKTFFVGPPSKRNTENWETQWKEIMVELKFAGLQVPTYKESGLIFHYSEQSSIPTVTELSGDIRNIDCLREFINEQLKLRNEATE